MSPRLDQSHALTSSSGGTNNHASDQVSMLAEKPILWFPENAAATNPARINPMVARTGAPSIQSMHARITRRADHFESDLESLFTIG
jgi:hypothetical protein